MVVDENKKVPAGGLVYFHTANIKALFDDGAEDEPEAVWNIKINPEVKKWLDQNFMEQYTVDDKFFYFDNEADAVAFKLRWT